MRNKKPLKMEKKKRQEIENEGLKQFGIVGKLGREQKRARNRKLEYGISEQFIISFLVFVILAQFLVSQCNQFQQKTIYLVLLFFIYFSCLSHFYYYFIFYFMSVNQPYFQKYQQNSHTLLPEVQISTSQKELLFLRKRLLANNYEKQISERGKDQTLTQRQNSLNTPRTQSENPEIEKTKNEKFNHFQINQMHVDRERLMKMKLAQQYQYQIERKESKKRLEREYKKRQQQLMVQGMRKMNEADRDKYKRQLEEHKNTMHQQLRLAQKNKLAQIQIKKKQQQIFNEKYALSRSTSVGSVKQAHFKQHYDNINRIQKQIENNYIQKWSPKVQQKQMEKQKFVQAGIFKSVDMVSKKMTLKSEQEKKLHQDLKNSLIQQIKLKQSERRSLKNQLKTQNYTTNIYQNVYHPICNPIDFRLARDNKYVLRQLIEQQDPDRSSGSATTNGLSNLARNGSISLLPK